MDGVVLSVSLAHVWDSIQQTREKINELLADYPEELRMAVTMAGSELLENAAKYGVPISQAPSISFDLSLTNAAVQLSTMNGSRDLQAVGRLQAIVQRIATTPDPEELYSRMMQELALHPPPNFGSGLGLYRIAAEGRFRLSCRYENNVVRVVARRSI